MGESVFEVVKQSVTVREAAEMYGIEVKRGGMACCPFHDDKNPSMKLNEDYFYCFGCGATGDVIDFTARLYDLAPKEAAEKLAQDFGLSYDSKAPPRRSYVRQKSEAQARKEKREHAWSVLADYYHLLRRWETDYSPRTHIPVLWRPSRKRITWAICWTLFSTAAPRNGTSGSQNTLLKSRLSKGE